MKGIALYQERWVELAGAADYNASKLAKLCGLSTRQLQRQFQRRLQRTPQEWLNELRMNTARQMLLSGLPVKRVAYELGFKYPSHFCQRFKSAHQMTPSEFRFHLDSATTNVATI